MQVPSSVQPPVTGPLTVPATRGVTVSGTNPPANAPENGPQTPPQTGNADTQTPVVTTGTYNQADFDPSAGLKVPDVSNLGEAQRTLTNNVATLLNNSTAMTPAAREQLNTLAQNLGFRNLDMLQHHLRNLSPAQKQNLLTNLAKQAASAPNLTDAAKAVFEQSFKGAIVDLFTTDPRLKGKPLPVPQFTSENHPLGAASWDSASLASVYNGLATIMNDSPERFALIAKGGPPKEDGSPGPLQFIRSQSPKISNNNNMFQKMSDAVKVAHTDCECGKIHLYDTAIRGDNTEIVNGVVNKLDLLSRVDPASKDLIPQYTDREIADRGLGKKTAAENGGRGESDPDYINRLNKELTGNLLKQYGGDPKTLIDAVNFVIGYKGLNRIETFRKADGTLDPNVKPLKLVDPKSGLNNADLQEALRRMGATNLLRVAARMEQSDAVKQMQGFLKDTIPGAEKISVDGMMGPQTRNMAHAFQAGVALNTLKERIEDDDSLTEQRKGQLIGKINEEFQKLAKNPEQAGTILGRVASQIKALSDEKPCPVSDFTLTALKTDLDRMQELSKSQTFNRSTAEGLVDNWLNVMDSGKGLDMGEQLVVHETGHVWEHEMDKDQSLQVFSNWTKLFDDGGAGAKIPPGGVAGATGASVGRAAATDMYQMNTQDFRDKLHNDMSAASDYGATSAREDFAEASRVFTYDPQRLMRRSLMKFLFINAINGNTHKPADIMKMAADCGYSKAAVRERLDAFLGQGSNPVNFGLDMSAMLNKTYKGLREELAKPDLGDLPAVLPTLSFPTQLPEPSLALPHTSQSIMNKPLSLDPSLETRAASPLMARNNPTTPRSPYTLRDQSTNYRLGMDPALNNLMFQLYQAPLPSASAPTPAAAPPEQPGWMLEHLSSAYKGLADQLQQPNLSSEDRQKLEEQISTLINGFVSGGPAQAGGSEDLSVGAKSFSEALAKPNLDYGENTADAVKGRAMVAAMAIYRATGTFDRSKFPQLAQQLPDSFDQLQREPAFKAAMQPGSKFASNLALIGSLERIRWYEQSRSELQLPIGSANDNSTALTAQLSQICLTEDRKGLFGKGPAMSNAIPTLMANSEVQTAFADSDFIVSTTQTSLNQAINVINRLSGNKYPPVSTDDVKIYLLSISAGRTQPEAITGENLTRFLESRKQGVFPSTTPASGKSFSSESSG